MTSYLETPPAITARADYPELVVEWLPTGVPFTADGDWCDITSYVRDGTVTSGRDHELERFDGSGTLELVATTRLFDREWTSGPFYPYLRPKKPVRVSAVWNGTRYPVWRGHISAWSDTVPAGDRVFYTTVTLNDAFSLFEGVSLPASWYELVVGADRPTHWWRFDETNGTAATDSGYGTTLYAGSYVNGPTLNDEPLVAFDAGRQGVTFDGVNQYARVGGGATEAATNFSCSLWFQTTVADPGIGNQYSVLQTGPLYGVNSGFDIGVGNFTGTFAATATIATAPLIGTANPSDGLPHHVVAVREGTTARLYVDGVEVDSGACSATALDTVADIEIAAPEPMLAFLAYFPGTVSQVAFFTKALTASQIAAHYAAGATGFAGDDTGTQLGRVLTYKGWPSTLRTISTGLSTVGGYPLPGTLREYVQRIADTELGQTYVGPSGELVHRARSALWLDSRSITSQATFGDGRGAANLIYLAEGFSMPADEALIRNPVAASRSGGVTSTVSDVALFDVYGEAGWAAPTSFDSSDNVMFDRASFLLDRYKDLGTRLEEMRIAPRRDPAGLWPQVLGRLIGDRITVNRTPLGQGNEIALSTIIESITHSFPPRAWTATYRGSPADATRYWILGDSTYGLLDTTTVLAY